MCTTWMDEARRRELVAHREFLSSVAEVEKTDAWKGDGAADFAAWLARRYQESYAVARRWVEDARALDALEPLDAAYASGCMSTGQMQAVGTLADSDTIQLWLARCQQEEWDIRRLRREARKETARRLAERDGGVYLSITPTRDERFFRLRGQLPFEDGAALMGAVDRAVPSGTPWQSVNQWRAVGLMELVRGRPGGGRGKPTIVVHVDADDPVGRIQGAGFLPAHVVERLARQATIRLAIDGEVLRSAAGRRSAPQWLADLVADRDQTCTFPGCERVGFLDLHHVRQWDAGGPTVYENLVLACDYHHSLVHRHGWRTEGQAGPNITWIRPDGTRLTRRGSALTDTS